MKRRVIFDTSALISAALRPGSTPYLALKEALADYDLCTSLETRAEFERVLGSRKFDRYVKPGARQEFASVIRQGTYLFAVSEQHLRAVDPPCRDPKDAKFLALAKAAGADTLVTGDLDLLIPDPWHTLRIMSPADFLARHGLLGI